MKITHKGYSKMTSPSSSSVEVSSSLPWKKISNGDKRSLLSSSSSTGTSSDTQITFQVIHWVRYSTCGYFFYLLLCIVTCGVLFILSSLTPYIKEWFLSSSCSPQEAEAIHILINQKRKKVLINHYFFDEHSISVEVDCRRYWTNELLHWNFKLVPEVPDHFSRYLRPIPDPNLIQPREELLLYYGLNKMELPIASFFEILSRTMVHPFYLFQYFAVILWMVQDYVLYSLVILFITGGAIYLTTSETVYNLERLHDLAGYSNKISRINHQTGAIIDVDDTELVPGDHILLRPHTSLPCDCVLLSGRISVDESMLTGESVPVNKSPIDCSIFMNSGIAENEQRDANVLSKNTGSVLFSGTKILVALPPSRSKQPLESAAVMEDSYSRSHCVGVVYRTSFRSAKGQLISTLLNPNENFMSFFSDAFYVIIFMAIMCTILYLWSAFYLIGHGAPSSLVALKYLDALTIAVPPGLTASLTVATGIAINRLKKKGIYVSESTKVNWAGIITAACFDKTGTLTEERLHFKGVTIPKREALFDGKLPDGSSKSQSSAFIELSKHGSNNEIVMSDFPSLMIDLMGTCHALSLINGTVCGDPLEVELFRASGYSLTPSVNSLSPLDHSVASSIAGSRHDHSSIRIVFGATGSLSSLSSSPLIPKSSAPKYQILKHFEFTSEKLRSGSLVLNPNKDLIYYCKGSPEKILELVVPTSVPPDTHDTLTQLSKRGFRVIACCYKIIARSISKDSETIHKYQSMSQSEVERECTLLGFVFLSNALKSDTVSTIQTLTSANISCTMITGDHIYTAIAIATDCHFYSEGVDVNIIDEDENSATGIQITSMLTGRIISYNLVDFLLAVRTLKESKFAASVSPLHHTTREGSAKADCDPQSYQIALTGRGLEVIKKRYADYLSLILHMTQVYARMKPSDKQYIVQEMEKRCDSLTLQSTRGEYSERGSIHSSSSLQISVSNATPDTPTSDSEKDTNHCFGKLCLDNSSNTHVVFCGDGANDMAALRAATVGVSLCEAETSVAAPITSRYQTPGSVVDVIKEGRCSLVTAYVLVTFNIMYATIQLFNAIMMYHYGLLVGNNTYLIQDLFFTLFLGLAISITPPAETLGVECPPHRFFTKYLFLKLFLQLVTFICFQLIVLEVLSSQVWYVKYDCHGDPLRDTIAAETSVIASIGLGQLIIASIVSCIDHPFRQAWWKNKYHLLAILGQVIFVFYQILGRESYFMTKILQIEPLPYDFCGILFAIILLNSFVSGSICWIIEELKNTKLL